MGLSEVLILVAAVAGFATGYLAAVLRHGDTKAGTPSASHNSESAPCEVAASCPVHRCRECRRYYDDMYQLT